MLVGMDWIYSYKFSCKIAQKKGIRKENHISSNIIFASYKSTKPQFDVQQKMFATTKALTSNAKNIFSRLVLNTFSQSKNGVNNGFGVQISISGIENPKSSINNINQNINFGITQAKQVSEISHELVLQNSLKKFLASAAKIHCFNPQNRQEEDIPIRIFETYYTVTFLPSVQFLEKEFAAHKVPQNTYHPEKDATLSVYKFSCQHCGHHETRSFPQNGYKYGTVLTGCDECHSVMVVSDHLGWVQPKKQKRDYDVIFSKKQVQELMRKSLKKVGINPDKDHDLD